MPPKSLNLAASATKWKCPQCAHRTFSASTRQLALGPEHPRFIEIPEPPQQSAADRTVPKGILPVPRNIFTGLEKAQASDEAIAKKAAEPQIVKQTVKGSREEWKAKMSEVRRQNLHDGLKSLKARQVIEQRRMEERSRINQKIREERLNRPEREDDRLTAPSNNFDLNALLKADLPDPARASRLDRKLRHVKRSRKAKEADKAESLHTLYLQARDFIVTSEQLNKAVDAAFGTPEQPHTFLALSGQGISQSSIWAEGKPPRVADMMSRYGAPQKKALGREGTDTDNINKERIRRIAEVFLDGKMDPERRKL